MRLLTSSAFLPSDGSFPVLPVIGILCLAGAVFLAYTAVRAGQREKKAKSSPRKTFSDGTGRIWQAVYTGLSVSILTRRMMLSIRERLEFGTSFDERGLRRRTAAVFLLTASLMAGLLFLFSLLSGDILLTGIFVVMLGFMTDTILDISVARIANRLLRQQLRFHEQLRHRYYEEQSVDGAVEEACRIMLEERAHEMYAQGEKLLDVLSAADTEATFELYRETAPNKYLKLLGGMCCITREYGDARVDGASVFLMSLGHLSEEIRSELFKRDRLLYAMKSLNVLSLVPMFFIQPIRNWAGESFAPMARFYAQGAGSVLEVLMVAITLVSYLTVRKLQQFDEARPGRLARSRWDAWLYRRWLHPAVDRLSPGRYTMKRLKMEALLKRAVSPMRVEDIVTRQLLAGTAGFIGILLLCLGLQVQAAYRILHEPSAPAGFLGGKLAPEDQAKLEKETAFDSSLLITLPDRVTPEEIHAVVMNSGLVPDSELDTVSLRIAGKSTALGNNRFKWWELLLCIAAFFSGWHVPVLSVRFQAGIMILDMEDEVARFQTIILMLMHMPRVDVEEVIEWMEMFSLHFRGALQTCLSDYSAGAVEALSALKTEISFEPMSALVGNLMLAASDLPILQAFEELESEKAYSREKRKELNERVVERKRNLGNLVGFIPLYALILLYLMIPMVVSSMTEMSVFYRQMSSF